MKRQEAKNIICVIFMFGFFSGILYLNIIARTYIASTGLFGNYFLEQYSASNINNITYMWYITKLRVFPALFFVIFANTRFARIVCSIFLVWTGFASGIIFTSAIFKLGIMGIMLCVVSLLPHFICYIFVYVMIINYIFRYPNIRWNITKTVCLILFMLLGIISETYINPVLLDIFIKVL